MSVPYDELTSLIYSAIDQPACWNQVMEGLCAISAARKCFLACYLDQHIAISGYGFSEQEEKLKQLYRQHCNLPNNDANGFRDHGFLHYPLYFPQAVSEFSNTLGCRLCNEGTGASRSAMELVLVRDNDQPAFEQPLIDKLNRLLPALQQVLNLITQTRLISRENNRLKEMLGHVSSALVVLNNSGHVLFCNRQAKELSWRGQLFYIKTGELFRLLRPADQEGFQQLLRRCSPGNHSHLYFNDEHLVCRVETWPYPIQKLSLFGHITQPGFMVMIQPGYPGSGISTEDIRQLFPLTDAEAEICCDLCGGLTPEQIQQQRHTSLGTIRQQIKSCLQKTESSSRSEMVSRILRAIGG